MKKQSNHKSSLVKIALIIFACALFAAGAFAFAIWRDKHADSGDLSVYADGNTLSIAWDTPFEMDACRVSFYDDEKKTYVSGGDYKSNSILIDMDGKPKELNLRLQAVKYVGFGSPQMAIPLFSRKFAVNPEKAAKVELQLSVSPEKKKASISWQGSAECEYEIYFMDDAGEHQLYSKTEGNAVELDFASLPLPDRTKPIEVSVRALHRAQGYMLYGQMSESVAIARNDLLENDMSLWYNQVDEGKYILNWRECYGAFYEVQQWSDKENGWVSLRKYEWTDELAYATERLPSNTNMRFRVIAYDTERERDEKKFAAKPSEVAFTTEMSTLYCTIWPIMELDITDEPNGEEIIGKVPAGQTLCVLEEIDGCFQISYNDCVGYVDARFCLINLPEYIGDLCKYDIANSYESVFRVHGYYIPEITKTVVKGYEDVRLDNGDYLVPYLYPCTDKLRKAALAAAKDGYALRIYDAFRPNEATRFLYDTLTGYLDEEVMEDPEEGEDGESASDKKTDKKTDETKESEVTKETEENKKTETASETYGAEKTDETLANEGKTDETADEDIETYRKVMTDGRFQLSAFLAASVSAHNTGIALDLTLVDINTDKDLEMQSDMHDLSRYSVIAANNDNARLLEKYMKGAGYNGLTSEWWHFQDDETKKAIELKAFLAKGISAEGWKKDDAGWKYRQPDGGFYKNVTVRIDGKERVFDAEGYCER